MKRTIQLTAILVAALVVTGGAVVGFDAGKATAQVEPSVTIEDQTTGGQTVIVDAVNLSDGGFVVIYSAEVQNGQSAQEVIGVSRYLEAGQHRNVPVTLARPLNFTQVVFAIPHTDTNGNQAFDFVVSGGDIDGPVTQAPEGMDGQPETETATETPTAAPNETETAAMNETETETPTEAGVGNETGTEPPTEGQQAMPVSDAALITVSQGAAPSTSLSFLNQTTNGTSVVVANVTLYQGGFITIHNDSLLAGDAVGSVIGSSPYLPPGYHEDVEITLAVELNESNQTLIAMPHHDTNQNQVYDFVLSGGSIDSPYVDNGTVVTRPAVVTLAGAEPVATETPTAEPETETPGNETTPVTETATPTEATETPTAGNETETPEGTPIETDTPTETETET